MTKPVAKLNLLVLLCYIAIAKQSTEHRDAPTPADDVSQPIYGKPVEIEHAAYTAAIYVFEYYQCVGSYVQTEWIMTAGYCILDISARDISITMGSKMLNEIFERRNVTDIMLHPNFTTIPLKNDLALLKIHKPFPTGRTIKIIELNEKGLNYPSDCSLAGWSLPASKDYFLIESTPVVLRLAKLYLMYPEKCGSMVEKDYDIAFDDTLICAKGQDDDACNGDSGAALVCNEVQVGIASTRIGECGVKKPSLYTNVEQYKHWIDSHIRLKTRSQFAVRNLSSLSILCFSILITIRRF